MLRTTKYGELEANTELLNEGRADLCLQVPYTSKLPFYVLLRKSHVHMEWSAAKKWPQNWGFMTQTYKEV